MVKHDILHRALYSGRRSKRLCLLSIINQSDYAVECSTYFLIVQSLIADSIFQREHITSFYQCLWGCQVDFESRTFYCGLTHLGGTEVEGGFFNKIGSLACGEDHLGHLHGRFGIQSIHRDGQHVLISITTSNRPRRGCSRGYAIKVHWLRGEQADGCFETIGSNFVRSITEKNNCQRAVLGSRTNKLCFALLQGLNQITGIDLCAVVDAQFLIIV